MQMLLCVAFCLQMKTLSVVNTIYVCSGGVMSMTEVGGKLAVGGGNGSVTILSGYGREWVDEARFDLQGAVRALSPCKYSNHNREYGVPRRRVLVLTSAVCGTCCDACCAMYAYIWMYDCICTYLWMAVSMYVYIYACVYFGMYTWPAPDGAEVLAGTMSGIITRLRVGGARGVQALGGHSEDGIVLVSQNHGAVGAEIGEGPGSLSLSVAAAAESVGGVSAVSYAPDMNDRFATVSDDNTIRVWDASEYTTPVHVEVKV